MTKKELEHFKQIILEKKKEVITIKGIDLSF